MRKITASCRRGRLQVCLAWRTWTHDCHVQTINAYRRSLVAVNGPITNGTTADVSLGNAYDYLGRLAAVTNVTLSPTNVTTYTYDNVGNLAGIVYPQRRPAQLPLQRPKPPHPRRPDQRQQHRPANLQLRPRRRRRPHQRRPVRRHKRDQNRHLRLRRAPPTPRPPPRLRELVNYFGAVSGSIAYAYDANGNRANRGASLGFTPPTP